MSTKSKMHTLDELLEQLPLGLPEARLALMNVTFTSAWHAYADGIGIATKQGSPQANRVHLIAGACAHGPSDLVERLKDAGLTRPKLVSFLQSHIKPGSVDNGDLSLPSRELVQTLREALKRFRAREGGDGIIVKDVVVVLLSSLETDKLLREAFDCLDVKTDALCESFGVRPPPVLSLLRPVTTD